MKLYFTTDPDACCPNYRQPWYEKAAIEKMMEAPVFEGSKEQIEKEIERLTAGKHPLQFKYKVVS